MSYRCAADKQVAKSIWSPGNLEVGPGGIQWKETGAGDDPGAADSLARVDVDLIHITGSIQRSKPPAKPLMRVQVASPGSPKANLVFRFLTDGDRDTVMEVLQALLAQRRETVGAQAGTSGASDPFATVMGPHIQAKRRLLRKDEALGDLYKQVVATGAVTDQEFWTTKAKLLSKETSTREHGAQKRGVSSALLSDIQLTSSGQSVTLNFKLTDEVKQHLFLERPKVRGFRLTRGLSGDRYAMRDARCNTQSNTKQRGLASPIPFRIRTKGRHADSFLPLPSPSFLIPQAPQILPSKRAFQVQREGVLDQVGRARVQP